MNRNFSIHNKLHAISTLSRHFDHVHWFASVDPDEPHPANAALKELAVDVRNVLELMDDRLMEMISDAAGPVWGELPEPVKEICRQAGLRN